MNAQSLNCPNCGAPLTDVDGKSTVVCDHCGSVIALKAPPPAPAAPVAPAEPATADPRYEYGQVPDQRPALSDLTSVALGPADAARVIQLLRANQEAEATQFYHAKVGGSLDEAKDAIGAIQAGLRDASAPIAPGAPGSPADPAGFPEVRRLAEAGDTIGAIKAYRYATGLGLREAKTAVEGLERQLRPNRMGGPLPMRPPARTASSRAGCAVGCLGIVAFFMCIFGGCGAYIQTKAIYQCSLREIKAALAQQKIFAPPIDGGYIVFMGGMNERTNSGEWSFNADYYAPVWGSNGWAVVDAHIAADGTGWNNVSAKLDKDGKTQQLFPARKIECGQ